MLTDITFYKAKFFGDIIPDTQFAKYESMAEDKIHALTFNRLINGLPGNETSAVRVQKAVCALADVLYLINAELQAQSAVTDDNGNTHRAVSSITAGSESITYTSSSLSAIGNAASDITARNRLIYQTVAEYLGNVADDKGINLLYAGV